jgi:signal transduction histidine kinase
MREQLVANRRKVASAGLAIGAINVFMIAFTPTEFARDQLPWMLAILPMFAVAGLLIGRVPDSAIGWLLLGISVAGSCGMWQGFGWLDGWAAGIGAALSTAGVTLLALLLLVFPDGVLPSHRWRLGAVLVVTAAGLGGILGLLVGGWGGSAEQTVFFTPVYEATQGFTGAAVNVFFPLYTVSFGVAIASLVVRYRRGPALVQQQLKWLLVGMAVMVVALVPLVVTGDSAKVAIGWQAVLLAFGMASVPLAIGIAVLRYRLYDLDLVISRSLTYGVLAVFIGAVYVGVVVGVGTVVGQGDRASFELSIVATAVVALAFQPVRRWVQRIANRLVFGERATPYEVLARFARRAAEASDDELLQRIPQLIVEGTGAAQAALWVRDEDRLRVAAAWPDGDVDRAIEDNPAFVDPSADRSLPVIHDGELLGGVSLITGRGETITPAEEALLAHLVDGLGLALRNAALTERLRRQVDELERSRDRVVTAADQARRSLEHDLDSGPQQQLVALKVKLGPIRKMAERAGAVKSAAVLAQLETAAGDAIRSVRDFAGGVYPPLLEAEGLVVAIGHQARKAGLHVSVEAEDIGRYPREVEAAVYFTVLEALQNTSKYADATQSVVSLRQDEAGLRFEIADDGRGFDSNAIERGAGLANMADRIDSVGGTLTIESAPGAGTTVAGRVPVAAGAVAEYGDRVTV